MCARNSEAERGMKKGKGDRIGRKREKKARRENERVRGREQGLDLRVSG